MVAPPPPLLPPPPPPPPGTLGQASAIRGVYYHSFAALSLLLWDCLSTLDDEVRYIWPMKARYPFKWLYLLLRYLPLAAQISYQYVLSFSMGSALGCDPSCKTLHMSMIILVSFTSAAVEFILAFRVFVLFDKQRWVALILGSLMAMECCCALLTLYSRFRTDSVQPCVFFPPLFVSKIYGGVCLTTQSTLVAMVLFRRYLAIKAGCSKHPILITLIRDATLAYLTILGLLVFSFVIVPQVGWQSVVMIFWTTTLQSACGSRLILNMARLPPRPPHQQDDRFSITSQIDLYPLSTLSRNTHSSE